MQGPAPFAGTVLRIVADLQQPRAEFVVLCGPDELAGGLKGQKDTHSLHVPSLVSTPSDNVLQRQPH